MIENRNARRRRRALARKSGQAQASLAPTSDDRTRNTGTRWRAALLGTTAAGALALAAPGAVRAQTVVPPSNGPCVVGGTTVTCTGDLSAGLIANAPLTVLNVNALTGNITPGAGIDGIDFTSAGNIAIVGDSGGFQITTTGTDAEGIRGNSTGGGTVSVTHTGNISANGDVAEAIVVDALGGGSARIAHEGILSTSGNASEGIDAFATGPLGSTGSVTVTQTGQISTLGEYSEGIDVYAYSGGDAIVTQTGTISTSGPSSEGIEVDVYRDGSATVTQTGDIVTHGPLSEGIEAEAQGTGSVSITQTGKVSTAGLRADAIEAYAYGGGSVTIVQTGTITTTGNAAEAIFVDTRNGGSVSITQTGDISTSGADAEGIDVYVYDGGTVTITQTGGITASGRDASAVRVRSRGGTATVTLAGGATEGGSGTAVGVDFSTTFGTTNTLNVMETASLSALSGNAIRGGVGDETVNNAGIVTGSVDLGGGLNIFSNRSGATFNSGEIVNLSNGFLFSGGTLSPGAVGKVQTTAINGVLLQAGADGVYLVDLDASAGMADQVTVTASATLGGAVRAHVINPVTGTQSATILSAAGGTTDIGLTLAPTSPAIQASLSFPNANDVVLTYSIDFSAGGLNPNQAALANALNATANSGTRDLDPVLLPLLNNIFTVGDYRNALNQLLPEVMLNTETTTLFSAESFADNLFSCRLAGQNHTALSEGECYWARPQGRFLDRDSDTNTVGFDETAGGLAAGAQIAVAPNWFAGFALGYERASLDTDTGAETDSNRFSGGLSLKYQAGSFLLGAAISGGVSGNDTQRPISFGGVGGFNATADSNYAIKTLTGQARAAYVFQFRDWFAKPLVDVTATYLSRDGVTETGAGAANLAISGSDETFFSVAPALEIGGDFALSETSTLRPYVRAGVSFYTDSDHGLTASFVSAPAGTSAFSITSDFDGVFADVAAGATAFFDNGSTLGLSYEGLISSDTQQHGVSLKGTIAF